MAKFLFSPSGRIGRGKWWLGQLSGIIILVGGLFLASALVDHSRETEHIADLPIIPTTLFGISFLAIIWINICTTITRYHDRNKSGWWYFFGFIPLIGPIWQLIELGFLSGDVDDNEFGPGPGFDISDDIERLAEIQSPMAKPAWQPVGVTPAKPSPAPAFGQPPKPMFGAR